MIVQKKRFSQFKLGICTKNWRTFHVANNLFGGLFFEQSSPQTITIGLVKSVKHLYGLGHSIIDNIYYNMAWAILGLVKAE